MPPKRLTPEERKFKLKEKRKNCRSAKNRSVNYSKWSDEFMAMVRPLRDTIDYLHIRPETAFTLSGLNVDQVERLLALIKACPENASVTRRKKAVWQRFVFMALFSVRTSASSRRVQHRWFYKNNDKKKAIMRGLTMINRALPSLDVNT